MGKRKNTKKRSSAQSHSPSVFTQGNQIPSNTRTDTLQFVSYGAESTSTTKHHTMNTVSKCFSDKKMYEGQYTVSHKPIDFMQDSELGKWDYFRIDKFEVYAWPYCTGATQGFGMPIAYNVYSSVDWDDNKTPSADIAGMRDRPNVCITRFTNDKVYQKICEFQPAALNTEFNDAKLASLKRITRGAWHDIADVKNIPFGSLKLTFQQLNTGDTNTADAKFPVFCTTVRATISLKGRRVL